MEHLSRGRGFLAGSVLLGLLAGVTPAEAARFLYVENTRSGEVTVISIPEHEIVGTIAVENHPDDVVAAPDGRVLYVNNQGGEEGRNEILAVDTVDGEILWRVPVEGSPNHMSITSDGEHIFVPFFDKTFTSVISTTEKWEVRRIFGMLGGHGTRLSPDDERYYLGSMVTDAIYVVDVESGRPTTVLNFDDGVRPFTFTKDEKRMYVQLSRLHGFDVVDLEEGVIVDRVHLPALPDDAPIMTGFPHTVNHGLELSPNEDYLLAAGSATDYVAVYSHPELELVKTIATGAEPNWIIFTPEGRFAYVTARASDEISVIDMKRLEEIKRIKSTGDYPQRMRVVDVPAQRLAIAE